MICMGYFTFNFSVNPEDHREITKLGWLEFEGPELGYSCD